MSTSREELADRLEAFLRVLESARRCENKTISVWSGNVEVVTEALEVARLAATPKAGVNVTDDSLAKTVTTAVLSALKAGGDNLAIFNAVKQALPSVLGGVDQKTTQTTKPSSSRAEDSASETAVSALAALADELEAAANWMQLYLDTYGEIGDDATQANIDDWHDVVKRARKSSDGGVVATTQASSSMEDKPDPLRRPVGGTINNHLSREAEVAPGPSEANSTAAPEPCAGCGDSGHPCPYCAAPMDAGVREALDHVLQSLNCLASGLLSPDQNELSTSMASVAAEAIPHAMIIAEALSSQPVVGVDQKEIQTTMPKPQQNI